MIACPAAAFAAPFAAGLALLAAEPAVELDGAAVVAAAHAAAGGPAWVEPRSLYMEGYGLFWRDGPEPVRYEPYRMWRVYPETKADAHQADGRVRIEAFAGDEIVFQIAFDGETTYDRNGPVAGGADAEQWSTSFGFGVIRHALDPGYTVDRLADDAVDGRPAYTVRVNDPAGGETLFAIAKDDHAILKVGFDTPRGWHERVYSDFFSKPGSDWVQPGRVRLFYDGVKANEIIWTDFTLNETWPQRLFVLPDAD